MDNTDSTPKVAVRPLEIAYYKLLILATAETVGIYKTTA